MAKRLALGTLLAASVAAGCGVVQVGPLAGEPSDPVVNGQAIAGDLVVQLEPGATFKAPPGAQVVDELDFESLGKFIRIKTNPRSVSDVTKSMARQPGVKGVEPNRAVVVPLPKTRPSFPAIRIPAEEKQINDRLYAQQWYVPHIGADRAWSVSRGKGIVVAVIDTGVDYTHEDLKNQVVGKGYSAVHNRMDGLDEQGHGTHVAGTIAAEQNNGEGVTGVAPDARILPVQVLSASGAGNLYDIAKGIKFAADYGVQNKVHVVANLSLGGAATVDGVSYTAGWYATSKGTLLVAAAGNSNTAVGTPARWDKYYMAISAIDEKDQKASFSNFGPEISVGAPGVNIVNTTPSYDVPLNKYGYAKWYAALQGTSMACPVAAGTAALVWAHNPDWNWQQVRKHIEKTAKDLGKPGKDDQFGHGMVQPAAALGL